MSYVNILVSLILNLTILQNPDVIEADKIPSVITDTIPAPRLAEDIWLLAKTIEDVHPEPYIETNGRIGYYRRVHEIVKSIPDHGLTPGEFYFLARQVVALVPDSHTWINDPDLTLGLSPGLPLFCTYLQGELVILALYEKQYESIIGSKLIAVEGVDIDLLLNRIEKDMNSENRIQSAHLLCGYYGFLSARHLSRILPEWLNRSEIRITTESADGKRASLVLEVPETYEGLEIVYHPSGFVLPSTERCDFAWDFIEGDNSGALLVVKGTMDFRENFEIWGKLGIEKNMKRAPSAYTRFTGEDAPRELEETIKGIPSASEFIRDMLVELKKKEVKTLIIDLRENEGGTSFFADILLYYLFGRDELFRIKSDYGMITRLSEYYYEYAPGTKEQSPDSQFEAAGVINGYDFSSDYTQTDVRVNYLRQKQKFDEWAAMMESFSAEYDAGTFEKYYCPENIIILTGGETYSAGLTFAVQLSKAGAKIAGSTSRQSPNCFGDVLSYRLPNSRISCNISHKKFEYFPGNEDRGKLLVPDIPLNYDHFKKYNFDLNAELLMVLEKLDK